MVPVGCLVGCRWIVFFLGGRWLTPDLSWWAVDVSCYFLVPSGCLLLFLGGLWMVTRISWWTVDGSFVHPAVLSMVGVILR